MEPNPRARATDGNPLRLEGPLALIFKFGLLAAFVAALLGLLFFTSDGESEPEDYTWPEAKIEVPTLDPETLAKAKDATREQRLTLEPAPLGHLLATALDLTSVTAHAAGMARHETDPEELRISPEQNRGRIVWFEGQIERMYGPEDSHPVDGYQTYWVHLTTTSGQRVIFYYSLFSGDFRVGDWVRAEGYFLALRDLNFPIEADRVPVVVGRTLLEDYRDWGEVTEFDPDVFRQFIDGIDGETFEPTPDSDRTLVQDQREPLWHLAAYARSQAGKSLEEWREHPALNTDVWMTARRKDLPRGTPVRVLGRFITSRRIQAPPNPAGIETWTEAWIQVPEVGGKLIPIWVASDIGDWEDHEDAEARGYFYKLHTYEPRYRKAIKEQPEMIITPVFVAASLDPYRRIEHASMDVIAWVFVIVVTLIILLLIWVALRDRKRSKQFEDERVRRRQRRRQRAAVRTSEPIPSHASDPLVEG